MSLVSELPICGPSVSTLCPPAAPPSLVTSPAPALLPTQYLQREGAGDRAEAQLYTVEFLNFDIDNTSIYTIVNIC